MFKYNDSNIFNGYIKQLLSTFNLPMCKPYVDDEFVFEGSLYIYDNKICRAKHTIKPTSINDFDVVEDYIFNKYYPNITRELVSSTTYYDNHTHQYLGNYLRFLRDYKHLDLMSLYNCYTNEQPRNLNKNGFNSNDTQYKIYMAHVRLDKKYTIALDCNLPIEIMCGFHSKESYSISDSGDELDFTYQKIQSCRFNEPFLYTKLIDIDNLDLMKNIHEHENDLVMYIKVPFSNKSSVVVLEGDYRSNSDFVIRGFSLNNDEESIKEIIVKDENEIGTLLNHNKTILNFKASISDNTEHIKNLNDLQVGVSYTFRIGVSDLIKLTKRGGIPSNSALVFNSYSNEEVEGPFGHGAYLNDLGIDDPCIASDTHGVVLFSTGESLEEGTDVIMFSVNSSDDRLDLNYGFSVDFTYKESIGDISWMIPYIFFQTRDIDNPVVGNIPMKSSLQLLHINSGVNHPFSDRLMEYLTNNAISNTEEISDNIRRIQKQLYDRFHNYERGLSTKSGGIKSYQGTYGIWEDKYKATLYEIASKEGLLNTKNDILGYVDKDVESKLGYDIDIYGGDE